MVCAVYVTKKAGTQCHSLPCGEAAGVFLARPPPPRPRPAARAGIVILGGVRAGTTRGGDQAALVSLECELVGQEYFNYYLSSQHARARAARLLEYLSTYQVAWIWLIWLLLRILIFSISSEVFIPS